MNNKDMVIPQNKIAEFTNFSDEDFTWKWDSVPYTFRKGSTTTLELYKALHFTKHLVNREIQKLTYMDPIEKKEKFRQVDDPMRTELEAKAMKVLDSVSEPEQSVTEDVTTNLLNPDKPTATDETDPVAPPEPKPEKEVKKEKPKSLVATPTIELELMADGLGIEQDEIDKATRPQLIKMVSAKQKEIKEAKKTDIGEKEADFDGA